METLNAGAQKLGYNLSPRQLEQFAIFYWGLVDWNQRMNLTRITDYEEVQVKHFLDSITVTLAMTSSAENEGLNVIDVGTGAGLPGIPLKILLPGIRLVLLEATAKKAKYLHHLINLLGLDDVEVVVGRAEEVARNAQYREKFELVLSRAVAPLSTLVELTLPFCTVGGRLIAQKKGTIDAEINRASKAITVLGGKLREIKAIDLAELADNRFLVVIDKLQATPPEYPRRPGVPTKRPIN
ncbi:16S rRNA (guanine(527)-N(7))-methyltransferase RsmG [Chloroflexota bacterium]